MINYEAWDEEEQIYNGTSKGQLINALHEYIENQSFIDESLITKEEVENLDEKSLKNIGIKLYSAKW